MTHHKCDICHGSIITHRRGMRPKAHGRCRLLMKRVEQKVREEVRAEVRRAMAATLPASQLAQDPLPEYLLPESPVCALCGRIHKTVKEGRECLERFNRSASAVADWRSA